MRKQTELTHSVQCCVSYRNQLFVLQSKTNGSFLYETQHWAEMGQLKYLPKSFSGRCIFDTLYIWIVNNYNTVIASR